MLRLLAALLLVAALAAPAAYGQGPFSPLPPAPPEPTAAPERPENSSDPNADVSRELLFIIGGGLIALFLVIGLVITRDARQTLPKSDRRPDRQRDDGPHRHAKQAKAKARAKTRAQRRARKRQKRSSR